jgi:phosphoribosylanthranilate isomerase
MKSPWIKICGITNAEATSAALSAGADAIGFIFAESPRRVSPERAYRLAAPVRGRLACVAVVRRTTQSEVDDILKTFRPDALQVDVDELANLDLPSTLDLLPVASTRSTAPDLLPEQLLLERPPADDGTGWNEAEICGLTRQTQLILAGGLHCGNVAAIVNAVHPFGVDVSRGVEIQSGIKSPDLIGRFVKAARALNGVSL